MRPPARSAGPATPSLLGPEHNPAGNRQLVRIEASVTQVIVRVELIPIQPFSLDMTEAVRLSMENRLDLMNRRASVVDARRQLETALRSLNRAQDELIEVWLDYETTRLNVYRDIGTMQIGYRGFWIDLSYQQMVDNEHE